ncbi:M48 family metallopeptidase [Lentisphaera profundi]|uniref:M48 family metallopeptidase n=1 Tax=Lentisphaera profundi TaxID=1658616 RepID=A0ABY7VPU2_9BACT|nr:M48 family metallopeptidase [Lentisphaera profundi]WDE96002.1 M48 family metallopeptidase [Lentisphaera profundi]
MENKFKFLILICSSLFFFSCQTNPMTGRSQLIMYSSDKMLNLSEVQYANVLKESKISNSSQEKARLQRVGTRIAKAVDDYLKESRLENNFKWEFNLIEDKQVNAWCMPGGKIAFYSGILPITKDDAGMAVVMGHEIAHAVAEHGNERMSQAMLIKGSLMAAAIGIQTTDTVDDEMGQAILIGAGGLASVGIALPNSRTQELEADYMGLVFMAKAGYNPERAIAFWQDMSKAGSAEKPPEFLSTHPGDIRRIDEIKKYLPKAMYYYRQSPQFQELEIKQLAPKN